MANKKETRGRRMARYGRGSVQDYVRGLVRGNPGYTTAQLRKLVQRKFKEKAGVNVDRHFAALVYLVRKQLKKREGVKIPRSAYMV